MHRSARLDRMAIGLSALCALHCVATAALLVLVSAAGDALAAPIIHEVGLVLAIAFGIAGIGRGYARHRLWQPAVIGSAGIIIMAWAMTLGHGSGELAATLVGVAILAFAHYLNHRTLSGCAAGADRAAG